MQFSPLPALAIALLLMTCAAHAVEQRTVNDGHVILEDVPQIPQAIVDDLNRFQNVRSARFVAWTGEGDGVYVSTRFADVAQLHRVAMPGGARRQLTFFDEPIGNAVRRTGGNELVFAMDQGGSEFDQLYLFDPRTGESRLLTDGASRNGQALWDHQGQRLAWQSTRRDGRANDIWLMDPAAPEAARLVLESPDGTWWAPADFSRDGRLLLVQNYVSSTSSSVHLVDLESGEQRVLAAGAQGREVRNYAVAIDGDAEGFYYLTDAGREFTALVYRRFEEDAVAEIITEDIDWDVSGVVFSEDARRAAFTVNEGGLTAIYLMDPSTRRYRRVDGIPTGVAGGLAFSPDGTQLAITLNTAKTPSDTFTLDVGPGPLDHGRLKRWTFSEVGGLDTDSFIEPELVQYPTFDEVDGEPRMIPAFVYTPSGPGPHPVVVSIHGGPESQFRPYFSSRYQMWLAKLGVAVVAPNVRGSSGYGKTYVALDNGFNREMSVQDIGALLDWIATRPALDEDRVALFGGSYGGYMVLAGAAHYSDRLKAAVDIVGISNFVTFLENTEDYRRDLRRAEYGDERDPQMREFLERISPNNNVDDISIPMFVAQGENDPRVPVTESEQIVAALREQNVPVWYMNALNEGHGFRKKPNRDLFSQITVLFFQRYLLGDGVGATPSADATGRAPGANGRGGLPSRKPAAEPAQFWFR